MNCFNPRPPRRAGATNTSAIVLTCDGMFQSSPAPKGGRYPLLLMFLLMYLGFNPRPPRRAGATLSVCNFNCCIRVSILARPEGRALLRCPFHRRLIQRVSILARPEGRALHPPAKKAKQKSAPFQSSPAPKGGRYLGHNATSRSYRWFQSSPAPKGGRYISKSPLKIKPVTFQSSPAPKGGRYR